MRRVNGWSTELVTRRDALHPSPTCFCCSARLDRYGDHDHIQARASDCQASPGRWGRLGEARADSDCHSGCLWLRGVQGQGTASTSGVKWTPAVILCRAVPLLADKHSTDNVCEWRMELLMHIPMQVNWKFIWVTPWGVSLQIQKRQWMWAFFTFLILTQVS